MKEINSYETKYDKNGIRIIRHKEMSIIELIKRLDIWHDEISQIML